jgi:hypothetical protein
MEVTFFRFFIFITCDFFLDSFESLRHDVVFKINNILGFHVFHVAVIDFLKLKKNDYMRKKINFFNYQK